MNHIEQARHLLANHASLIDTPYRHSARQSIDDWALEHSWDVLTLLVEQEAEITRLRGLLATAQAGAGPSS